MTGRPFEVVTPGSDRNRTLLNEHGDDRVLRAQYGFRIPRLIYLALHAARIQMLPDVAFAMRQRDRNQWKSHIRRGSQSVAGQDAKTPAVGRYRRSYGDFHREVLQPPCSVPGDPRTNTAASQ